MDPPQQERPSPVPPVSSHRGPPPFQFSLKWMIIAVTAVAVLLALGTVVGQLLLTWVLQPLVTLVLPTALLTAAIFGRDDLRAFAIGALVPYVRVLTTGSAPVWSVGSWLGDTFWLIVWCALCGVVAVATRRWIVRHGLDN